MGPTSGIMCATTLGPAVCSTSHRPRPRPVSSQRLATLARFLRQPAEGIATEVDIKEPTPKEKATVKTPSMADASPASSSKKSQLHQSLDDLGVLAGNLLMNAASWRVVRGQTYCLHCQGTGRETCTACHGAGILQPDKVRMNQIRHAGNKLQVLLGADPKMFDGDWMKSNRCKRCHGTGALPCKHCNGTGMLGPSQGSSNRQ